MTWDKLKGIKNKKQIIIGLTVFLCVVIIGSVYYKNVISTAVHYKEAVSLYEDYDYLNAQKKFEKLGDYKDSEKLAKDCSQKQTDRSYNKAISLMEEEDYEGAIKLFRELGDYQGSDQMVERCKGLIELKKQHDKVDPVYTAFYKAAKEYFDQYGKPVIKKDPDNKKCYTVVGVNCLNLVDFDDNGVPELVVGGKNSAGAAGEYSVYVYDNDAARQVTSKTFNHHSGYYAFELHTGGNGYQLYCGNTDKGELLTFDGKEFKTDVSWENNADDKDAKETYYIINGKKVTKKEYLSAAPNYSVQEITEGFAEPFQTFMISKGSYTVYPYTHMTKSAALNLQSTSVEQTYNMLKESYDRTKEKTE